MMRIVMLALFLVAVAAGMPPKPGMYDTGTRVSVTTGDRYPVFPDWFGKPGPNKLMEFDYCETVTILMQFPDNMADTIGHSASRFDSMLYSVGVYNQGEYRQGSLNDFFLENSYNSYDVRGGIGGDRWFTSSYNYSEYYDGNYLLSTGSELARDNVRQIDSMIDFSQFDLNQDGHIDAMFMVHAGPDGADNGNVNCLWSHAIPYFNFLTDDGVRIDGVTNVPEFAMVTEARDTTMCCIAVMCHELGHLVGLPDLYDGSRRTWGVGYWGLMGYGAWGAGGNTPWSPSHMEAWSKVEAGFVEPVVVTRDTYDVRVLDIETHPLAFKVWRNGADRDTCFYLENRQQKGFDAPLPGPGLLIWHIDPAERSWHNRVDLEEDSTFHLDSGPGARPDPHVYHELLGDTSDPLPGIWSRTVFDDYTTPSSRDRYNQPTLVGVRNIRVVGDTVICDITISDSVGVEELPDKQAGTWLTIAPNPAWDRIVVQAANVPSCERVRICNSLGEVVREVELRNGVSSLRIADIKPGVYVVCAGLTRQKLVKAR